MPGCCRAPTSAKARGDHESIATECDGQGAEVCVARSISRSKDLTDQTKWPVWVLAWVLVWAQVWVLAS